MRQRIESLEQFRALQAEYMAAREAEKRKILVCCGTGCVAGGNLNVYHELKKRMDELASRFPAFPQPGAAPRQSSGR